MRGPPRGGFSLIEVLFAMVILTVGAASLLALYASAAATHKRSVDRTRSALAAEEILSEVQSRYPPGAELEGLRAKLQEDLPETLDGYRYEIRLARPGNAADGEKVVVVRKGALAAPARAEPSGRTVARKPAGAKSPRPTGPYSEDELLVRVRVAWSQSGSEVAEEFDTILLPRPIVLKRPR